MKRGIMKKVSLVNILTLIAVLLAPVVFLQKAQAVNLTEAVIRLDRLKAETTTGGTVCAKATSTATEATVDVTFPTGFTVNATAANWTVTTTNLPLSATAWPGIGTATAVASQVVTFPSGDLTVGTLYCFNFSGTTTLTTSTAGNDKLGVITTYATGPTEIDTANYALSIVSNDQIVISAVVPPLFTFALGGNTDSFTANLSSSSVVSTTGNTATVETNADNGWTAWVKSANVSLDSASTGGTIDTAGSIDATPTNLNPTTGYVLDVDATTQGSGGTGTMTIDAEYNGTTTEEGGTLSTAFQPIGASNGTTDGDVMTLIERAFISSVQEAATDYTDTLTVVAAGLF